MQRAWAAALVMYCMHLGIGIKWRAVRGGYPLTTIHSGASAKRRPPALRVRAETALGDLDVAGAGGGTVLSARATAAARRMVKKNNGAAA